ncbi:MAG: superoxide dismutase [Bacteroides sp.]|nr:superoxide dismutase [Bacteroides sp.]
MNYSMPTLPYSKDALAPVISQETIDYHYGKHLQTYVNNLNALVSGTPFEGKTVEEIVITAPDGAIFNNAGQVLNHTLYFLQFTPQPEKYQPEGKLAEAIQRDFGNFENFKNEMTQAASSIFGSGWAWLAMNKDGKLVIVKEPNGSNPLRQGLKPLLGFDVWEHAYYLDYQNRRTDHLANLWKIIDWKVVENRM